LNPIEESFSTGKWELNNIRIYAEIQPVKAWIRRNWRQMMHSETPELDLLEACGHITAEMARIWFKHSGYNV